MGKRVVILGGGLAGISSAYFLQDNPDIDEIIIIEKEDTLGGLCRSFKSKSGITFDIGPHIFFSKNKDTLDFMEDIMMPNINVHRRSNIIIHDKKYLQYPFENDLGKLSEGEKQYVESTFRNNPYENYEATNMRQFFLKTFGVGISKLYLLPYNEKIWKFDPTFMDLQMVERIPKPPIEDIERSLKGETVDGYLHQLNFFYPESGGTKTFIDSFAQKLNNKIKIRLNEKVHKITKKQIHSFGLTDGKTSITEQEINKNEPPVVVIKSTINETTELSYNYDILINTIPLTTFVKNYDTNHKIVKETAQKLISNKINIGIVTIEGDIGGNNFAFYSADVGIKFHRFSKLDFFGKNYHNSGTTTFMTEVTERDDSPTFIRGYYPKKITEGLEKLFGKLEIKTIETFDFNNAYVINDLDQQKNKQIIFDYFNNSNIYFTGRQGSWQYLNMDQVIEQSQKTVKEIIDNL